MATRRWPLIDAHVHFWALRDGGLRYPWLTPPFGDEGPNGNVSAIARPFLPADYARVSANWDVRGAVHVEAGADASQALEETDWLETLRRDGGLPSAIVAHVPLDAPDCAERLAAQAARPGVRGVRHIVNWHADPRRTYTARDVTRDAAWQAGFGELAQHGLSFDLQAYPSQFHGLAELFAKHSDIQVIVNHAGMGVERDPAGEAQWREGMRLLAQLPQVSVKLSGLGFACRPLDPAWVRGRVRETVEIFGPERAMIASDWPTDALFGGFDETLGLHAEALSDLPEPAQRAVFAGNANRIYRLSIALEE